MVHSLPLTTGRAKADFGTTNFYATFGTIAVIVRFCCKAITVKRYSPDDYTILTALLFHLGMCASNILEIKLGGMGRHIKDVPMENLIILGKNLPVFQCCWSISLMFVKLSFLFFFSKIFSVGKSHIIFKIATAIVVMWGVGGALTSLLICQPIALNWDPTLPGHCRDRPASYIIIGVFHILTDVMVLAIPIPFLWRLQMPTSRKISLSAIFCLGFICCIISLIRVIELSQVTYDDITYSLVPGSYWTLLEPALALFVASLPAIAPVIDKIHNRMRRHQSKYAPNKCPGGNRNNDFEQLDDKYLLSNTSSCLKDTMCTDPVNDLESAQRTVAGKDDEEFDVYNHNSSRQPVHNIFPLRKAITRTTTISTFSKPLVRDGTEMRGEGEFEDVRLEEMGE